MLDLIISTLTQGFIYALLSFGVYITYKILDFPDLTVDGSFPLGAAVTAVLLVKGVNPYLALLISFLVGALAGFVTGFIHVRLKVRDLLSGIITMTALFSINLQIAGSNLSIAREKDTIFTSPATMSVFGSMSLILRKLIVSAILMIVCKVLLDLYFKTKNGFLLRAVGDNSVLVTSLSKDKGTIKIIGLVISNALVALSGAVACQIVFGLAAVIIGTTLFRRVSFIKGTTAVIFGSVIYKACIQIAISLGLPANLLKLITAVLFLAILVLGNLQKGSVKKNVGA